MYIYIYISVMKKGYRNHKKPHSEDCNSKIACYIKMWKRRHPYFNGPNGSWELVLVFFGDSSKGPKVDSSDEPIPSPKCASKQQRPTEIPWNTYVPPYNLSDLSHPKFWDKIWRHKSLQFIKSWPLSNSSNSLFFFPRLLPGRANKNKQGSTPTFILEFLIICGLCNNVEHSKWTSKLGKKQLWKCCFD